MNKEVVGTTGSNVRCSTYFIIESAMACTECERRTAVFAFALPAGYESLDVDDNSNDNGETWEPPGFAAVLSYVEYLPWAVSNRMGVLTSHYRLGSDGAGGAEFWRNHCEHCDALLDEEDLHGDFDSPFGPLAAEEVGKIRVHRMSEPFEARVGAQSHDVKELSS